MRNIFWSWFTTDKINADVPYTCILYTGPFATAPPPSSQCRFDDNFSSIDIARDPRYAPLLGEAEADKINVFISHILQYIKYVNFVT